jgi:hypothetical protein
MSGGSYDYAFLKMYGFIEQIDDDLKSGAFAGFSLSTIAAAHQLSNEAKQMAEKMKSLEWMMSGDSSEEQFLAAMND